MKYRVFVAVASLVLAAVILLLLPPAAPSPVDPSTPGTHLPGPPDRPTAPAVPSEVRIYSCNDQWLEVFDSLAAQYTAQTGTEVIVLRPDEDGCEASLSRLMASENPPVMLCIHSQEQLEIWQANLIDLQGTALATELVSKSFGIYADNMLLGITVDLEAFGLLTNAELLGTKGALSRDDLTSLSALTTAAQILKSNSVKAFPPAALDTEDVLQLIFAEDTTNLRAFLNLYAANAAPSGNARELFLDGKCAFYLGGTWDYEALTADADRTLQARNLDILPTFSAGALQYTFSTAWCINGHVSQNDLDATLQFMSWLVTAGEDGTAPVDSLQMLTPFADAHWYDSQLDKKLLSYMRTEPAVIQWTLKGKQYSTLAVALQEYVKKPSDEAWINIVAYLSQLGL